MAYENMPRPEVDYAPCRYGNSRLSFRGPRQRLDGRYIAVLGGSETFGRYLRDPYPSLLQAKTGVRCVNFGCVNAGVDAFLHDETVIGACRRADAVVLQVCGARNLSNRFYGVHPRRNDRLVRASAMLRAVFPEVDFTEFHFTGHLLRTLEETSPTRFRLVRDDLRRTWIARMNLLMAQIGRPVTVLWIGRRAPEDPCDSLNDGEPAFIDRRALNALYGRIDGESVFVTGPDSGIGSPDGKTFTASERSAALAMPGPSLHHQIADQLARTLAPLLRDQTPTRYAI
ncbi:DUF6473 family protein [Oceaniglobus indicus]|uniref:DUF6473 family protein n=1 Tax=Oceaniglobus indicus TaxID=2047749 RepID=UPI000C184595|nr:DUF6473 family protein [Oceaniglobus indicus]